MLRKILPVILLCAACSKGGKDATEPTAANQPPETPSVDDPVQRPSERNDELAKQSSLIVQNGVLRPGSKIVAILEDDIGPQFSSEGQDVTATIVPATATAPATGSIPAGGKISFRVHKIQAAMEGTKGFVYLVPRTLKFDQTTYPVDARIVAVTMQERRAGDRQVAPTVGGDVSGSILKPDELNPSDRERDILGRGTAISVGMAPPHHQLDKGSALILELRSPLPLAVFGAGAGGAATIDISYIRDLTAILDTTDEGIVGKAVDLTDVPVESVIGDTVFWVGQDKKRRVLVVMDPFLDTPETKTIVIAGQRVTIAGQMNAMPDKNTAPQLWSMVSTKEAAEFTPHPFYILANRVTIHSGKSPNQIPATTPPKKTN